MHCELLAAGTGVQKSAQAHPAFKGKHMKMFHIDTGLGEGLIIAAINRFEHS